MKIADKDHCTHLLEMGTHDNDSKEGRCTHLKWKWRLKITRKSEYIRLAEMQ